jgi:malate dehydrogenase
MQAVMGATGIVEPSFVYLPGITGGAAVQKSVRGLDYFSLNLELGVISEAKFADDRSTVRNELVHLER